MPYHALFRSNVFLQISDKANLMIIYVAAAGLYFSWNCVCKQLTIHIKTTYKRTVA